MTPPKTIWLIESPTAFWFSRVEVNDLPDDVTITKMVVEQQRKPLTDEQIDKAMAENKQTLIDAADNYWKMRRAYARIIEAAHGIKGDA